MEGCVSTKSSFNDSVRMSKKHKMRNPRRKKIELIGPMGGKEMGSSKKPAVHLQVIKRNLE